METMTDIPDDETFVVEQQVVEQQPSPAPARAKPRVAAAPRMTPLEVADEQALRDWMSSLAGDAEIKVNILRKKPMVGANGENVGGSLETVTDRIDEDYIRENWGGGTYMIRVQAMTAQGDYKFVKGGQRQIQIAGPPKMHGALVGQSAAAALGSTAAEDGLAERAFNAMERTSRENQERADKMMREQRMQSPGLDIGALQALQAPIIEQLRTAQDTITKLQMQMVDQSNKPAPRDDFRDRLMERALSDESTRINALRDQHESRLDKLRDQHEAAIIRLEDRHAADIKRMEAQHERDLRNVEKSGDSQTKSTDVAYQARIESLKDDKARLERDLTALSAKVAALEARKDQTPAEKATELMTIKDALDGLGGGDDKEEAWYEKLIGTVGSLPAVTGILEKLAGPGPQQPGQVQQQLPPPGVPFSNGDGNVYVRDAAGNVSIVDQGAARQQRALAKARKKRAAVAAAAGEAAATEGGGDLEEGLVDELEQLAGPPARPPDASEVKIAVSFMENALRNGTTPEAFGATARNLMPTDILQYIQQVGPEEFLNKTARLESGSPLASIRGREFCRKVFKFLVGDSSE